MNHSAVSLLLATVALTSLAGLDVEDLISRG